MQRILSLETSRSSNLTSEFVTKRLCCSFILTVAFFAVIGGFFLGRFATDKTLQKLRMEISDISKKIHALDSKLKNTFHDSLSNANCSVNSANIQLKCEHWKLPAHSQVSQEDSTKSLLQLLDELNNSCFNNG